MIISKYSLILIIIWIYLILRVYLDVVCTLAKGIFNFTEETPTILYWENIEMSWFFDFPYFQAADRGILD